MTLRTKLSLMLSIFLVLIAFFAGGTILIFEEVNLSLGMLHSATERYRVIGDLETKVSDLLNLVNNWALTGDVKYRKQYRAKLQEASRVLHEVDELFSAKAEIPALRNQFEQITLYAKALMDKRYPMGDPEALGYLQQINSRSKELLGSIARVREASIIPVIAVARQGHETKKNMMTWLLVLITFSSLASFFLIKRIRHAIEGPFNELLKATERIGKGELSYRIQMKRKDEFGIISDRFDGMVSELELSHGKINRKLGETELFLEVTRIAGTTLEVKEALSLIAETISAKLHNDGCFIYMLTPELNAFTLAASSRHRGKEVISLAAGVGREISETLAPVFVQETDQADSPEKDCECSFVAVPIIHDVTCTGILGIRSTSARLFSEDEINALKILAQTIGSVVRNAELYQSTRKQLQKLSVLYELSRAVTSVLDLEELLKKIAEEISRLLSCRGGVIRFLENGKLRVRSRFGPVQDSVNDSDLVVGQGIAGWVAARSLPLLIEHTSEMPEGITAAEVNAASVICVPLLAGEAVIGTLGLYDKYDQNGTPIPFNAEDLNTAEGFASISAIAIEKSKIFENEVMREKEANEAKKRLDILFDSVQGGIITLDREFTIVSANKYVEDWVSLSGCDLIGRSSLDIFHEKIGICPHCAAKVTFETGEINSIMQSRGVNYAELTAYPVKSTSGEITECVVFILDITERVLYQEETLSLYREVIQTKEYLESIIDNSADAIVTTDLEGVITSWNLGAEKTFGFTENEAIGKFLPFVPDFLLEKEKAELEKIKKGEVLKDIETLRRKKDGNIIEVSLTLSPIKDPAGEVIGMSGISRDISEKKSVEKELILRNQELSRLFFISSAMRGTLELDKLLRMVLIAVTMSDGMGFNRAILFLIDEAKGVLKGAMGVGPASPEEAWRVWDELSFQRKTLEDIMQEVMATPLKKDSFLDRLSLGIEIPLDDDTVLTRTVKQKRFFNVQNVMDESLSDAILIQQLGTQAYAVVPLISRDKVIGVIWVDNYFNRKIIADEDMKFLASFSNHVAAAIENARLFQQVKMAEQQLENIFESMSDMVYFNSKDYVIQSVNRAVCTRLGLTPSQIIGKKCYEVFHGTTEPFAKCPHHKTVNTKRAYIEELEDPHLKGTFLTSSSPIFDLTGEFIGSVHVVRDITELRNLQEKLVMSEKMAALGEVAAKVAHEIRNPLVSVGGFAKRLEKKLDGNLREYAGIIVKEVERLEGILKEILGFVKEVRLSRERVNLNFLVDDILTLMQSDIEDRGIQLVKDFGRTSEVYVDPNRVKEALMNIVSNAVQSLSGSGSILIRTYVSEKDAVVEIRDSGRGIPESDRPYIFNPFFTTKASGTGLGLAITHRIIQEHNGKVEVESELEKGSAFRVYLPCKEEDK